MKFQGELKGVDFESDYLALSTETKEVMAASFAEENFDLQQLVEMRDEANPNKYKALLTEQRKHMKIGYERVKQKARDIRQEYRIAVKQGTRSRSSRVVHENW